MSTATATPIRYVSATDTAKMIRAALRDAFPGTKFSVITDKYAGGASIRVRYSDINVAGKDVRAITDNFESAQFDGMTDSTSYKTSQVNGETIYSGANYVFVSNEAPGADY